MSTEPFFDDEDVRDMRDEAVSAMRDRCAIYAPPSSSEADKGEDPEASTYPDDWQVIDEDVPCRLASTIRRSREQEIAGRIQSVGDWIISIPVGKPYVVEASNRIRITTLGNRDFEVINPIEGSDATRVRIECNEIL